MAARVPLMQPPHELVSARIRLRIPVAADAQRIFERWAQDERVTRYLVWRPHRDVAESEAHVARCLEGWRTGREWVWMIEERESGQLVGSIAARHGAHGVDVGYLIASDAWGHGYMTEALRGVTEWFFDHTDVERVWATCDVDNHASARVLEKAGFLLEGVLRRWVSHPNVSREHRDARCYSRIRGGTPADSGGDRRDS